MQILVPILILVIIIFAYVFYAYNRLTQLRNVCEAELAQVDVLIKKRHDLIPNLIEVVKGYVKHEQDVLEKVSAARTEALKSGGDSTGEMSLSSHVKSILALREQYPDLKASEDFLRLQSELFRLEDEIAERRFNYNDVVKAHNDFILKFPGNVVAGFTGFALLNLFEFTGSRDAPKLNLVPGEEVVGMTHGTDR